MVLGTGHRAGNRDPFFAPTLMSAFVDKSMSGADTKVRTVGPTRCRTKDEREVNP